MPVAAPRLTDVGAGDPQPLVLGRLGQHLLEQLAIARLQFVLLVQGAPRDGDPIGKGVADPLQVLQVGDPRHVRAGRHLDVEDDAGKGLGREAGQLVLEAADLAPQLDAREALVAPHSKHRECVSIEQFWHKPKSSVNHSVKAESEKPLRQGLPRGVRRRSRRRRSRAPRPPTPAAHP
jgi:hypothetical protein